MQFLFALMSVAFAGLIMFLLIVIFNGSAFKFVVGMYKKITGLPLKSELIKVNKMYKCNHVGCNRLFRQYQRDMYKARHERLRCPHCEGSSYSPIDALDIDEWMDTHPDCPKLSMFDYKNVLKTIELLHKLRKEGEQQQRFEEYNKLKVDLSWVKNLEKEDVK